MNKTHMEKYIVSAVLVVAIIGIVSLLVGNGGTNLSGYATRATCGDGTCARNEARTGTCAADCTTTDTDGDGLYDYQETYGIYGTTVFQATDSTDADSDGDGLTDYEEVITYGTNPTSADSDRDTLSDYDEVMTYSTNPMSGDTDGDGHSDAPEISLGTDPNDASDYPVPNLPDLVLDEAQTSVYFEGTAWINNADGTVINNSVNASVALGINNQGTGTASGTSYNSGYILDSVGAYVASASFGGVTLSIIPSATQIVNGADRTPLSYTAATSFLQDIYDGGSPVVTVSYTLDYASTRYITESDETNNAGTYDITLDSSMYNIKFICIEYVASGSTTYTTAVETTCT